jgi:hypothetical protein
LVQPEMKAMRRSPRMVIKNNLLCFTIYSSFRTFSEKEVLRVTRFLSLKLKEDLVTRLPLLNY